METPDVMTTATLRLNPVLDLNAAGPLAHDLLALRGQDLAVDASAVQRLGAQCLQVLLSAKATWGADSASFTLQAGSPEFIATLAQLGAPIDQAFQVTEPSA
jgi:chemotaxis protein CheX